MGEMSLYARICTGGWDTRALCGVERGIEVALKDGDAVREAVELRVEAREPHRSGAARFG